MRGPRRVSDDEVGFLICGTFHSYNEILTYKTSKQAMANCGHLVWIAQAGRRQLKLDAGLYVICQDCALQSWQPPDMKTMSAPGAFEEIEEIAGAEARRYAEAWFRRTGGRPGRP